MAKQMNHPTSFQPKKKHSFTPNQNWFVEIYSQRY